MTRRYQGYNEWMLDEVGEESCGRRQPVGEVKQSTLDLVDAAAADLKFRDAQWQANRDKWFEEWKRDRPTETLSEFVGSLCEQIRRG